MSDYKAIIVKLIDKGAPAGTLLAALETNNLLEVVNIAMVHDVTEEVLALKEAKERGPLNEPKLHKEVPLRPMDPEELARKQQHKKHVFNLGLKRLTTPKDITEEEVEKEKCDDLPVKASSYEISDLIITADVPPFLRNLSPDERIKRLKELQRGLSPEELRKKEEEEAAHAQKVKEEVEKENTPKIEEEPRQQRLPMEASERVHLVLAKAKSNLKGLTKHWKEHFKGRPKGSFTKAVKKLKAHGVDKPEALAAYWEHKSTGKWPAEKGKKKKATITYRKKEAGIK